MEAVMARVRLARAVAACLLATVLAVVAAGCWSRHEIEELAMVSGVGFDLAPDGESLDVTVVVVRPERIVSAAGGDGGGQAGGGACWITGARGRTALEALRNLSARSPRKLFFGQATVLVIGEDLARRGLAKIIDLYERNPEMRLRDYVVVARGTAREVLSLKPNLEATQSAELTGICRTWQATSQAYPERVYVLARTMVHEFSEAATAAVQVDEIEGRKTVTMRGMAAFRWDRLVGYLDAKEARGYMWLTGKSPRGTVVVRCPADPRFAVTLQITRSRTSARAELAPGGHLEIRVVISVEAALQQQEGRANIVTVPHLKRLDRELSSAVRSEVDAALARARLELGSDIFGFGELVSHRYPDRIRDTAEWRRIFRTIPVVVSVKARVVRAGSTRAPAGIPKWVTP